MLKINTSGILHFGHPILHNIGDSRFKMRKTGKIQNLLVLAHAQPELARAQPVPAHMCSLRSVSKIYFWESVIFLHKFSAKSVISDSKCPKSEKN